MIICRIRYEIRALHGFVRFFLIFSTYHVATDARTPPLMALKIWQLSASKQRNKVRIFHLQQRYKSLLAELPSPSWDIMTAISGLNDTREHTWLATPLTCGVPCIACYDGIVLPFHYSLEEGGTRAIHDAYLNKAQKRLMPILRAVRSLLRRAESLDLVLEAELCWPALDSSISLAQCVHAIIGDEESPGNDKLVSSARLHIIDVLPSLSPKTHYHRNHAANESIEGDFNSLFIGTHASTEMHIDAVSPMSDRRAALWQLFFGKERFCGSNVYCSHYRELFPWEFAESKLKEMFYSNRIRRQGAVLVKHEGSSEIGIVYNAIRFVKADACRVDKRPAFQYSPRLFQESVEIIEHVRSYFLQCRTLQGVTFDVLRFPSEEDYFIENSTRVQIVHFGYVGIDGKPHLAVENTELRQYSS